MHELQVIVAVTGHVEHENYVHQALDSQSLSMYQITHEPMVVPRHEVHKTQLQEIGVKKTQEYALLIRKKKKRERNYYLTKNICGTPWN